jgi:hypothetical protein
VTLTAAGSDGGTVYSVIPTGANYVNEYDYISFPATGGSGASIAATFFAVIDKAGV